MLCSWKNRQETWVLMGTTWRQLLTTRKQLLIIGSQFLTLRSQLLTIKAKRAWCWHWFSIWSWVNKLEDGKNGAIPSVPGRQETWVLLGTIWRPLLTRSRLLTLRSQLLIIRSQLLTLRSQGARCWHQFSIWSWVSKLEEGKNGDDFSADCAELAAR